MQGPTGHHEHGARRSQRGGEDTRATIVKLQTLRERGVRIAVDDFGTGYSSLGYLRQFPVDILKIARDFVVPADRSANEWAFAHAIVALGRTLGLRIVAEGIEEAGQVERLRELGCSLGQGFHFARPMNAGDLGKHLGLRASSEIATIPLDIPAPMAIEGGGLVGAPALEASA